jgi:hypothetical protein
MIWLATIVLAVVAAGVAVIIAMYVHQGIMDRRVREALDDAEAWIAPLLKGSRSAERALLRDYKKHGRLLLRRTSEATRRRMAALDARKPRRSWLPSWLTRPAPSASPAAVGRPPVDEVVEVHHDGGPVDGAELLTAPLGELPPDVHAGLAGAPSPIGDQLEAELGTVPEPPPLRFDEDALAYSDAPDNTTWRLMRDDLFAMLAQPGGDAEGAGVAS